LGLDNGVSKLPSNEIILGTGVGWFKMVSVIISGQGIFAGSAQHYCDELHQYYIGFYYSDWSCSSAQ
jgi:hypothetical protein